MSTLLLLAPMAEISHRPFRELVESFGGCDEYFTEMISAPALLEDGPFEAWYIDAGPVPKKTVYQLVGADTDRLAKAAAFLDKKECAGIDINMGCSAPAIARTGAGVRWMESIERAGAMIAKVRQQVKHRLSVKLRIGYKDDFDYLVSFCRCLEAEGVELITLHPRTAKEKFRRNCRWGYVPALKRELKIPVAGNGDISSVEEMIRRGQDCDAVMIGRLAVRKPWIFAEAKAIQVPGTTVLETGIRFLDLLAKYQPPEFYISRARRFFSYFCDNLKWGNYLKTELNKEPDLTGIERAWKKYFAEENESV